MFKNSKINEVIQDGILFDAHCHLNYQDYDSEREELISKAKEANVNLTLDVAVDLESSIKSVEISKKHNDQIFSFVGIDPEVFIPGSQLFKGFIQENAWFETVYSELSDLITNNLEFIAGIGETGIDLHHNEQALKKGAISAEDLDASRNLQIKLFETHLKLAEEFDLPLTIHSRGAEKLCLEIAKQTNNKGIFHSYTGDYETAKEVLDNGFGLGVNGIVTFKNANELREMYKKIIGRIEANVTPDFFYQKGIYFETDAPYLSPEGHRSERNQPANISSIFSQFVKSLM